jgi:hypothetical protein
MPIAALSPRVDRCERGHQNNERRQEMTFGLVDERVCQTLMYEQEAHTTWVTANAWQYQVHPRRTWRQTVAAALVALANVLAPATIRETQTV